MKNELRNSEITFTDTEGKQTVLGNVETKSQFPELSFLFAPFGRLYKEYASNPKAVKLFSEAEKALVDAEKAYTEKKPFKRDTELHRNISDWFLGELDSSFYYNEYNNEALYERLEDAIASC